LCTEGRTSGEVAEEAELLSEDEDYSAIFPEEKSELPSGKHT
jgi:hypothetical protein